jgi:hypothetical protein
LFPCHVICNVKFIFRQHHVSLRKFLVFSCCDQGWCPMKPKSF